VLRALLVVAAFGAIALAAARPVAVRSDDLQIGQLAPRFLIDTLDGKPIGNFSGEPAYINVFATWCAPCRRELPAISGLAKRYGDRISFLFVDEQEAPALVKKFAASFGVAAPVAVDRGQLASALGVRGLPWSIFIDREGIVQYVYPGSIPTSVLRERLLELVSS
jgi:thiol-disulfide isomerase/thioredoxin